MNPSSPRRLNVLIMHPDPIVCAGLVAALRHDASFEMFVHADDRIPSAPTVDVVIADYHNAMVLTHPSARQTHGALADSRILALTANDREADIRRAIQAGVRGYLLPGGSLEELTEAVTALGDGVRYLCRAVAQRLADSLAGVTLTQRENDVLRLLATGQSNKEIARQLAIELGTVKSHVSSIMNKLGAISRTQAATIAVARGLVAGFRPAQTATFSSRPHMVEARPQFA
jgi:DNA-binding NarL/FixJ family response regulator